MRFVGFLSSPRRRRRLAWVGGTLLAVSAIVGAALAMPGGKPLPPEVLTPAPPIKEEREVAVTPAMRSAINETLDRFMPAALERRDPELAWQLAGPGLRAGTSRRDWIRGELPVHPYPARPQRFDGWRVIYAYRDQVAVDLLVYPRKEARRGPIVFGVDLVRRERRWLVDSVFPTAVFSDPGERPQVSGTAPVAPGSRGSSRAPSFEPNDDARLSPVWIAVPALVFGAALLVPLLFGIRAVVQDRRARARYAAAQR